MKQETRSVNRVVVTGNILDSIVRKEIYIQFRKSISAVIDKYFKRKWIPFTYNNQQGYWNSETQIAVPVQKDYNNCPEKCFGIDRCTISERQVKKLFGKDSECPQLIMNGIKASKSYSSRHHIGFNGGSFAVEDESCVSWNDSDSIQICTVKMSLTNFKSWMLSGSFTPGEAVMKSAVSVLNGSAVSDLTENDIVKLLDIFSIDKEKIWHEVDNRIKGSIVMSEEMTEQYVRSLLECDYSRAGLDKYDRKCLEDVNSGHWELWTDGEPHAGEGQVIAQLRNPLRARNPVSDIHENGIIGIDFGTKSTIVSMQDGSEHTTLLRVGIGNLSREPKAFHYENPTIMEFINLQKFIRDFNSRSGRPETSINDLRVSHAAENDLKSCQDNSLFDSFFYEIKQWCGDERRSVRIIDQQNVSSEIELAPFANLSINDFNPLTLYAYYLGLYINNMHQGIFLDYVISFPVTYKLEVKNKILECFRAGLWKSMPETVQNNKETNSRFRVRMGVSEPAAYAITALQNYGFDPEDHTEKYLYSIFDFGGGTTDFDFGIWRGINDAVREEEDKDYVIEHINSEGDKYLGGENLLELLAFEIFKANNDFMRTGKQASSEYERTEPVGFSFTMPPECTKPSGCETTIRNTPSAKRNTRQLMEVLRPFWEGIIGVSDEKGKQQKSDSDPEKTKNTDGKKVFKGYIFRDDEKYRFPVSDDGTITVDLFDNNGELQSGQKLFIQNNQKHIFVDLIGILEKRIEKGVRNFFDAVMISFGDEKNKTQENEEILIFLAGNSSKSPILRKLFDKYIRQENEKINKGKIGSNHFRLFPPLGTEEAVELQKKLGIPVNNDITAPTGKTGVAYGLISGREGGPIRVISEIRAENQSKFMFNIGKSRRGKFSMVLDRNETGYDQWVRFGVASSEDFEIYYTSLPGAANTPVTDPGVHKIRCRLAVVDNDADIFIRTIEEAPEYLEFAVSKGNEPDKNAKVTRVHLVE